MSTQAGTGDGSRHRGYISIQAGDPRSIDFLASMGWHLKSDPQLFNYQGDVVINDDFVIARYSHGPGVVEYSPPDDLPKGNRIMIHACISGSETLHTTTGSGVLKPLSVIRVMPEEFTGSECETGATSMFVIYRTTDASKHRDMLVGQSDIVHLKVLNAAAASLLQNVPEEPPMGFAHVQRGLEELAKAVAADTSISADSAHSALTRVYVRGLALIRSTAINIDTSVESVAFDLGVSRSYLLRAFKIQGTSPSSEIRRERLAIAKSLLSDGLRLDETAEKSGFGSVRNLKRALKTDVSLQ